MLRISGVTLQTWGFTFTGVRCVSARGFKRSGFDPERRDKEEEDAVVRLLFLRVKRVSGVGVCEKRKTGFTCSFVQHIARVFQVQ